ncbi:MAG TPA: hypothetical protein VHD63_12840 [Ktedonobacteraceae bacterium]|nr:hypothetical protein [Ktedonobacteraceae bacterium]
MHHLHLTPQRQAHIYATGLLTILTLGTLAAIGACLAALWALVELATLLVTSIVECCSLFGQTYASADPLVKFLLLVALGFVIYRVMRKVWR